MGTKIFAATSNRHKLNEISTILAPGGVTVMPGLAGLSVEINETGDTFEENAEIKATAVSVHREGLVIADDSGLVVDALDGAPGVRSARFAGENASDEDNWKKLLDDMKDVPEGSRTARFVAVIVLARRGTVLGTFRGECEGIIGFEAKGENGFGYDPVFIPTGEDTDGRTMAELSPAEKNAVSHRRKALEELREHLRTRRG